ncbi:MAG: hypothetical protein NTW52_03885 [Planctomycetota bacterium]|nr:hypothetical protein [Planctomycetota bacterium]
MANQNELLRILRAIPPKWALGIIGLLIGYWLLQPTANRTFGWNLPTLVQIVNNDVVPLEKKPTVTTEKKSAPAKASDSKAPGANATTSKKLPTPPAQASNAGKKSPDVGETDRQDNKQGPTFGYLKSLGRDRYASPEGLVYAPGSEEGHRLKHVERHIVDMPDRAGSHGVFEGSMAEFLTTIDQGYQKASSKAKGTKIRDEEGMTIMEITFDKKIGFVGGSEGRRKGNPSTKRLRIVLNGDRVITAFPF